MMLRGRRWLEALAALVLSACVAASPSDSTARMRYLALGDSYTIGEGVENEGRWTYQLAKALREDGIALDDPRTIATTGWTTDELAAAIDAEAPVSDYDFVTLAIGVNNQYRGRDVGNYEEELDALLRRAIAFAKGRPERVLMLSIPDWGATDFGRASGRDAEDVSRQIDAHNEVAAALCQRHGIAFVDIAPLSRELAGTFGMLADDGLHPSAAQYAQWAALALPVARKRLASASPRANH